MNRFVLMLILAAAAAASGCGRAPVKIPSNDGRCIGLADDVKTLRPGDELPRVVQVLGWPDKVVRSERLFGGTMDILQYDVQPTVCMRNVLHVDKTLYVVFDNKGRYVRSTGTVPNGFFRGVVYSTGPLVVDPVVLKP